MFKLFCTCCAHMCLWLRVPENEMEADPQSLGYASEASYHLSHIGQGQGQSLTAANPAANDSHPPSNLQLAVDFQELHLKQLEASKHHNSEDPQFFVSDMQKLALIDNSFDPAKSTEKPPKEDDPEFYKSDPVKLALLNQNEEAATKTKNVCSLEEAKEQSTPYKLQEMFDKQNCRTPNEAFPQADPALSSPQHDVGEYHVQNPGAPRPMPPPYVNILKSSPCETTSDKYGPVCLQQSGLDMAVPLPHYAMAGDTTHAYVNVPATQPYYVNVSGGYQEAYSGAVHGSAFPRSCPGPLTVDMQNASNEEREMSSKSSGSSPQAEYLSGAMLSAEDILPRVVSMDSAEMVRQKQQKELPDFLQGLFGGGPGGVTFENADQGPRAPECGEMACGAGGQEVMACGEQMGSPPTHHSPDTIPSDCQPIYIRANRPQ